MPAPDDLSLTPPLPGRVAVRTLLLATTSCRSLIEKDASDPVLRKPSPFLAQPFGAGEQLEPAELVVLSTPLGGPDKQKTINMSWQSE